MFTSSRIRSLATTRASLDEVGEYLPQLALRKRLPLWEVAATLASLPIRVYERGHYRTRLARARRIVGKRDPDDVDLLALALLLEAPVWSNDDDFKGLKVRRYTTAELLKRIE